MRKWDMELCGVSERIRSFQLRRSIFVSYLCLNNNQVGAEKRSEEVGERQSDFLPFELVRFPTLGDPFSFL